MKLWVINKLWQPTKQRQILNREISQKNEKPEGFSSKVSKTILVWKRTTNYFDIRFKALDAVATGDPCQIQINRDEIFRMASRYLRSMSDETFLAKVREAGGLPAPIPAASDTLCSAHSDEQQSDQS